MDKNGDGKVTEDEVPEEAKGRFNLSESDTNGDGGVDAAEMEAGMRKRMAQGGFGGGS
jgi:hypothetical protein